MGNMRPIKKSINNKAGRFVLASRSLTYIIALMQCALHKCVSYTLHGRPRAKFNPQTVSRVERGALRGTITAGGRAGRNVQLGGHDPPGRGGVGCGRCRLQIADTGSGLRCARTMRRPVHAARIRTVPCVL